MIHLLWFFACIGFVTVMLALVMALIYLRTDRKDKLEAGPYEVDDNFYPRLHEIERERRKK